MTPQEQAAFLDAYENTVSDVPREQAAKILHDHLTKTFDHRTLPEGYTSVLDALGMWHSAIKWQMQQTYTKTN